MTQYLLKDALINIPIYDKVILLNAVDFGGKKETDAKCDSESSLFL